MAIDTTINAGAPPLLWSDVQAAFDKVNQNFIDVQATIAGASITPVDFTTLRTDVSPAVDNNYNLGSTGNKWAAVFASEYSTVPGNEYNGLWLGDAHVKGIDGVVDLPAGSKVNGSLIIDPERTAFKEIQVNNDLSIVATQFSDSFNLISGSGIDILVNSSSDAIEISNSGILDINNGDGISVTTVAGTSTIENTGVRSLTSTTSLPTGRTAGAGINIDNSTGDDIKITNTGVISVTGGSGISATLNAATGDVTVSNSVYAFSYIQVNSDTADKIAADSILDTFIINSGTGISITKNSITDSLTFAVNPVFDLTGNVLGDLTGNVLGDLTGNVTGDTTGYHTGDVKGSVVADDSIILVDGVDGRIVGPVYTSTLRTSEEKIALGFESGNVTQGTEAIAIGKWAGETNQGLRGIAIGFQAGWLNQQERGIAIGSGAGVNNQGAYAIAIGQDTSNINSGANSIAIGQLAGGTGQGADSIAIGHLAGVGSSATYANSIILNASGGVVTSAAAGFFVAPVRNQTGSSGVVQYDSTTKEVSYSSALGSVSGTFTGNIFTSLIDSADSTAITVTPAIIFNADVNIENDIQLSNIDSSIRGTDKIKFVPKNADELSDNVRLEITSDNTIEPRLAIDTPDGVDLTLSSGLAGIVISKINGRVNLAAGNNAFIVRENGSWWMTPLAAAPGSPTVGLYIADCTNWDPASKANGRPYPVWYDGTSFNALY